MRFDSALNKALKWGFNLRDLYMKSIILITTCHRRTYDYQYGYIVNPHSWWIHMVGYSTASASTLSIFYCRRNTRFHVIAYSVLLLVMITFHICVTSYVARMTSFMAYWHIDISFITLFVFITCSYAY